MTARKRKYHVKIPHEDDRMDVSAQCKSTILKCGACGASWATHKTVFVSINPSDKWIYAISKKNPKIHLLSIR